MIDPQQDGPGGDEARPSPRFRTAEEVMHFRPELFGMLRPE
ncbi:hypothetical protein SAMN00790413_05170 [Deinococcus hopiensis KR-140]|uniref:Uncharacterized protein n=1 Tax=Deinococcus hopiensis KR-140 TaxID=695939 RepID=A0A1W1UTQ2_9DEIO|nr:hypothetical protein SAMN00790413_05170 [Deinococcus hopiensis KR-140]